MIRSLAIIFVCLFLGDGVSALLGIPIPGNVIGMILLTLALMLRVVKLEHVKPGADVLTRNLGFFFVPPGVGLMIYTDVLRNEFAAIVCATVISTFIVLAVAGWTQQLFERPNGDDVDA